MLTGGAHSDMAMDYVFCSLLMPKLHSVPLLSFSLSHTHTHIHLQVVKKVCDFCNRVDTPGEISALQFGYVGCLAVLISGAFYAKLLSPGQPSNAIPRSLAKQLQDSGFLQHLPKLLSTAAEQLAAVKDGEVIASCSMEGASLFTPDGRLQFCILRRMHSHVAMLLTLHRQLQWLPAVDKSASPALGLFDSSTLPVLQLSVTVLRHMSHIIDLLASVQAPGLRPDVFERDTRGLLCCVQCHYQQR